MRKIIAITQVSLDGVMQAPGGPGEDPSNGFTHGGWAMPFVDDDAARAVGEIIAGEFDMLLGRRTYEIFAGYWPNQGDNPIAKAFNKATKYVVTRSLDRLDWEKSQRIDGDVVEAVRQLKASDGPALHIWGSSELLQTLIAAASSSTRTIRRPKLAPRRAPARSPHPARRAACCAALCACSTRFVRWSGSSRRRRPAKEIRSNPRP